MCLNAWRRFKYLNLVLPTGMECSLIIVFLLPSIGAFILLTSITSLSSYIYGLRGIADNNNNNNTAKDSLIFKVVEYLIQLSDF